MILSGKALRFLYLALAPSLCLTNELAVEGEECSACLACRQMKGVAEIHAVSVPLKGYLQSVRVWEYDIRHTLVLHVGHLNDNLSANDQILFCLIGSTGSFFHYARYGR